MTNDQYRQKIIDLVYDAMIAARDGDLDLADKLADDINNILIICLGLQDD